MSKKKTSFLGVRWITIAVVIVAIAAIYAGVAWRQSVSETALLREAGQLYAAGELSKAADFYKAKLDGPLAGSAAAWNNYGNVLRDTEQYNEAETAYLKSIELDPTYEPVYRNLLFFYIDRPDVPADIRESELTGLRDQLLRAHQLAPKSISIVEDLMSTYRELGDNENARTYQDIRDKLLQSE
ncbi:hypothetical protein A2V68_00175 [candidate division Kazan bacterium RBG_13_50_9]|uniref:Uncharacterized protein n=1 Tax=candidate division Kazan bacterium RBG_13_50_9 TaxID=1798535 RepID=A0A1F4NS36_UNCK3|nr:MAG: hypothetical protein A2V68_00175 [candidate division Kazan bacterium RBG_13_50_9]